MNTLIKDSIPSAGNSWWTSRSAFRQGQAQSARQSLVLLAAFFSQNDSSAPLEDLSQKIQAGQNLSEACQSLSAAHRSSLQEKVGEHLSEIISISRNGDSRWFWEEALDLGIRMKMAGELGPALAVLSALNRDPSVPGEIQGRALRESAAILGRWEGSLRAEFLISQIAEKSTDYRLIVPMALGTAAFNLGNAFMLGRFAGAAEGGILSRGLGGKISSGLFGFTTEVATFAVSSNALRNFGDASHDHSHGFEQDLASIALTLGIFKLCGLGANYASLRVNGLAELAQLSRLRGMAKLNHALLTQATTFGGLLLSRKMEEAIGSRSLEDDATVFTDAVESLVSLGIGSYLGKEILGSRVARFQSELGLRVQALSKGEGGGNDFFPIAPMALQTAGGRVGPPVLSSEFLPRKNPMKVPSVMMMQGKDLSGVSSQGIRNLLANPNPSLDPESLKSLGEIHDSLVAGEKSSDPYAQQLLSRIERSYSQLASATDAKVQESCLAEIKILLRMTSPDIAARFRAFSDYQMFFLKNFRALGSDRHPWMREMQDILRREVETNKLYGSFLVQGEGIFPHFLLPHTVKAPPVLQLDPKITTAPLIGSDPFCQDRLHYPIYFRMEDLIYFQEVVSEKRVKEFQEMLVSGKGFSAIKIGKNFEGRYFIFDGYHRSHVARSNGNQYILGQVGKHYYKGPTYSWEQIRVVPHEQVQRLIDQNTAGESAFKDANLTGEEED